MNISRSYSAARTPVLKNAAGPIDIILDEPTDTCAMAEEKAEEIIEAENERLDQLMIEFTRGFDPGIFADEIAYSLPKVLQDVFPGSYEHLLSMLYESDANMHATQVKLETWLLNRYPQILNKITERGETNITDETYFGAEIEILRKLLAYLRKETDKPVFWLNSRRASPTKARQQLEASIRVIELFKNDVMAAMRSDTEDRKIYNPLPVSMERTALLSIKQLRIDACKASLSWDGYMDSAIVLTSFFHAYKAYTCKHKPDKARAWGWLPPRGLTPPPLSAEKARVGDLTEWSFKINKNGVFDLLLKTALWLGLARGLPAVHLFCDVARLFTTHMPSKKANETYVRFLRHLTQTRVSIGGIKSAPPTPIPYKNKSEAKSNDDYFEDVWRSDKDLAKDLAKNLSLFDMNTTKDFKLATAPPRRSFRKKAQMIEQACVVEETFTDVWPQKDPLPPKAPSSSAAQRKPAPRPQNTQPDLLEQNEYVSVLNW
ncbi:uncharacterized protein BO80DRAFT_100581 [Aspergillus ibericus CBS 121593]|uniref:Uncharacterized protein n=1 Tax=Aspergillus ibericus CBS 121593 TaxID=1448316 RepID=A0A395GY38_9EURO|nr:hypothetical protein BO80DRAFT_100581 [Aspergillus ibericus CBS 121593]RAL00501.1 hypothetical protein BO80DRAFT_100581 [Aspergillus ibericus CBS 121593]